MVTEVSAILVASITYTHHMQKENLTEFIASEDKLPFVCFGVLYETLLAEYVYVYERERESQSEVGSHDRRETHLLRVGQSSIQWQYHEFHTLPSTFCMFPVTYEHTLSIAHTMLHYSRVYTLTT